ncbi:hypothetical protein KEJ19_00545 [Candidatus Bathyarchaeota archaeon]|nr:hypothetical protein [Candidatus Bathyarchaeota archaeon]
MALDPFDRFGSPSFHHFRSLLYGRAKKAFVDEMRWEDRKPVGHSMEAWIWIWNGWP